jgi:hypothetical protein
MCPVLANLPMWPAFPRGAAVRPCRPLKFSLISMLRLKTRVISRRTPEKNPLIRGSSPQADKAFEMKSEI